MMADPTDDKQVEAPQLDAEPGTAALIIFGRKGGKPHASRFNEADAHLAEKAAGLMGMKILRVTTDEHRALASKLPEARVFESGKAFCPFISGKLFEQLEAMGGEDPTIDPATIQAALDDQPMPDLAASNPADNSSPTTAPTSWDEITVGSVVLATEGYMEGWYEAVVTAAKPNHLFTLKWRDWPEEAEFVRKRGHLGLLPPAEVAAKAAK